jgi:hypothetical protein
MSNYISENFLRLLFFGCSKIAYFPEHRVGIDGDSLRYIMSLVDTHQLVCEFKHVVSQTDDDKLTVSCFLHAAELFVAANALFNVFTHNCDVFVVKSCVDFIHAIEWGRFEDMKGEYQTQRTQSFLST